jgi:hypothetical protein
MHFEWYEALAVSEAQYSDNSDKVEEPILDTLRFSTT